MSNKTYQLSEDQMRNLKGNVYMISNGIRRERQTYRKAIRNQTIIVMILAVLGLISVFNWYTASSRLSDTQEQLRYEAGQAASFRDWYNKNCTNEARNDAVCGVENGK